MAHTCTTQFLWHFNRSFLHHSWVEDVSVSVFNTILMAEGDVRKPESLWKKNFLTSFPPISEFMWRYCVRRAATTSCTIMMGMWDKFCFIITFLTCSTITSVLYCWQTYVKPEASFINRLHQMGATLRLSSSIREHFYKCMQECGSEDICLCLCLCLLPTEMIFQHVSESLCKCIVYIMNSKTQGLKCLQGWWN